MQHVKRYENTHAVINVSVPAVCRLIQAPEPELADCLKKLHPTRLVTGTQKRDGYKALVKDVVRTGVQ